MCGRGFGNLEDGEDKEESEKADNGKDGEDDGAEVLAALDFAVDAEDVGFVLVAGGEAVDAEADDGDSENAEDDENGFHGLIIA